MMSANPINEKILSIERLSVALPARSDRAFAVTDLSLDVHAGEIVCIVGESGSGKSISAFTVMGLLPPEVTPVSGRVLLQGEDLLHVTPQRYRALRGARMAMIFQEPMTALNPVKTIGIQIEESLRIHTALNARDRRQRTREMMAAVHLPDIDDMMNAYPHQLSGGQRQRVMIASALILDPALLIADEPTTALDVTTQAQILRLIADLRARQGTGVLFITHDFGVVAEIADRVAVMQKGHIVEQGPADAVLRNPQHPYTQMLIAAALSMPPGERPSLTDAPVVLETKNLCKIYHSGGLLQKKRIAPAAQDVTLQIKKGETLGIVGESGSGKSTVARCIARLISPSSGIIALDGENYAQMPEYRLRPQRRRMQIVFQDPYRSLNPRRTIAQSMTEAPENFGVSKPEALGKARELLGLVGLDDTALARYPHQFSGGQRQRICIARALMTEPELLIADEAVSALDVSVQAQVLDLLNMIRTRFSLALLFITHDLRVAAQICDRLAVMQKGRVVEQGITAEIFAAPQNAYTKALFAAAPGRDFFAPRIPEAVMVMDRMAPQ